MSDFAGIFTEDMEGEELAQVVIDHWCVGAGATLFIEEVAHGCAATGISADSIKDFAESVNEYRHHDFSTDVLAHAFVPADKERAVRALLDVVVGLCVSC